ncbi:putative Expanded protein [Daphnia magna]|uniref:Putative Expanded protein n=1 Tax=Daphnia magna TaxID=35525 RepID=A0A162CXG0_9CRUS|nr:putative Expanded protein [Daphnia magna]
MPAMHRDHRCLSTGSAQLLYIKEASSGHTHYGLHLYRLRSSKKSDDQQQLQLQQQQHHAHTSSGSSSSHHNSHRLRSAERTGCDSRLSGASVTLDRPNKTHKLDPKIESVLGLSSSTDDSSNGRTPLERTTSQPPCSTNENQTVQQLHEQQQPHTGTVWLGICGRGIDIYEEEDSFTKTVRATFQWPNIGKLCFEVNHLSFKKKMTKKKEYPTFCVCVWG